MPVSEIERMELVGRLSDAVGKEAAETLMACVLSDGRDQLATKSDLAVQFSELRAQTEGLAAELRTANAELRADFAVQFSELRAQTEALAAELRVANAELRADNVELRGFVETKLSRQARLHYGTLSAFLMSMWGMFATQIFVM